MDDIKQMSNTYMYKELPQMDQKDELIGALMRIVIDMWRDFQPKGDLTWVKDMYKGRIKSCDSHIKKICDDKLAQNDERRWCYYSERGGHDSYWFRDDKNSPP